MGWFVDLMRIAKIHPICVGNYALTSDAADVGFSPISRLLGAKFSKPKFRAFWRIWTIQA